MRVLAFLVVSTLSAWALAAQGSWLDSVRRLDGQGRTREALSRLEAEPERLARDTEARLLRGVLLAKVGRTAEARELYQRLILEQPDLPEAYNNLAVMHAAAGDYDTAIEILKQGLATHSSYHTTYDNLTKVYGKLAGEAYSKALGDERIDDEPLRLALINELGEPPPLATGVAQPVLPAEGPGEDAPAVPVAPPPGAPVPQPAAPSPDVSTRPQVQPEAGDDVEAEQVIWQVVQAWADAWSGQRTDLYLSFYASSFVPSDGSPRADWEEQRRRRLAAPAYVRVSLALLEVERPSADRATAHFIQSYESDRFRDTVTKTLELVLTEAGWRIAAERVEEEAGE